MLQGALTKYFIGWTPVADTSAGLEVIANDTLVHLESAQLLQFGPLHLVMTHNLQFNETLLAARQLWRRFDVETKTFGVGMASGHVSILHLRNNRKYIYQHMKITYFSLCQEVSLPFEEKTPRGKPGSLPLMIPQSFLPCASAICFLLALRFHGRFLRSLGTPNSFSPEFS